MVSTTVSNLRILLDVDHVATEFYTKSGRREVRTRLFNLIAFLSRRILQPILYCTGLMHPGNTKTYWDISLWLNKQHSALPSFYQLTMSLLKQTSICLSRPHRITEISVCVSVCRRIDEILNITRLAVHDWYTMPSCRLSFTNVSSKSIIDVFYAHCLWIWRFDINCPCTSLFTISPRDWVHVSRQYDLMIVDISLLHTVYLWHELLITLLTPLDAMKLIHSLW